MVGYRLQVTSYNQAMSPSPAERSPHEQATLIFDRPEAGQQFREQIAEKLPAAQAGGVDHRRDVVAAAVTEQFAANSEGGSLIREPWQHTRAEHAEAQQLVDIAFAQDLPAALKAARQSPHYPRNLDLFHDVLTDELYTLIRDHQVNQQPVTPVVIATCIIIAVLIMIILLLIILA